MKKNLNNKNLSYFTIRLQELLLMSFPEKAGHSKFIERRATLASNAYNGAFTSGISIEDCNQIADYILFEGLHFSKFDTVLQVVCNGILAKDPETASLNFIKALEKIPTYIENESKKIKEYQKDLPVLEEIVKGIWNKDAELSSLKTELASVERQIQLSLAPVEGAEADIKEQQKHNKESVSSEVGLSGNSNLPRPNRMRM